MKLTTYTPEFRAEAVKLVLAQGLTLEEAVKRIANRPYAANQRRRAAASMQQWSARRPSAHRTMSG